MANKDQWCFAWLATRKGKTGKDRLAQLKGARWNSGDIITVSFLDGDPAVQRKVKRVAQGWTAPGRANLVLDFREDNNTLVRISFKYSGSWSVIGTTCKQVPKKQPTMNFGWLTPDSEYEEIRRVVLHEFGHALGMIHEHQNPGGTIHWNRKQVIKDLSGPPNSWTIDVINHNMFEPYSNAETNHTVLDPRSIMMYPLPKKWTTDGFSVGLNDRLSTLDKQFVHTLYP